MKAVENLPNEYKKIFSVDLQNDKKVAVFLNVLAFIITILLIIPVSIFIVPITTLFNMEKGLFLYFLRFIILLILIVVYMILHELVHGIAMKICGTKKIKYGFTGLYAFAGSNDYYNKKSYIFIALAPIVILGIVIAIINLFVSIEWFWVIYFLQVINISGATGDIYVTLKFAKFPKDILVKDSGTAMDVYSKN